MSFTYYICLRFKFGIHLCLSILYLLKKVHNHSTLVYNLNPLA
jgi:hypothetical protein